MTNEAVRVLSEFCHAQYGCSAENPRFLTVGETIACASTRVWITAWNPLGLVQPPERNAAAQERLCASLGDVGLAFEPGYARSPGAAADATWFEPCAVVVDPPLAFIDALARADQQLAVVVAAPNEPARLRCYRACWLSRFGAGYTDAESVDCGVVDWIA